MPEQIKSGLGGWWSAITGPSRFDSASSEAEDPKVVGPKNDKPDDAIKADPGKPADDAGEVRWRARISSSSYDGSGGPKLDKPRGLPPPPRLLGDLAPDTPVALTSKTRTAGFTPPSNPRLFIGAQVTEEGGGATGKFVGYTSSGRFLVDTGKVRPESLSRVSIAPNQQFTSICETLKPEEVTRPAGNLKANLDALADEPVAFGGKRISHVVNAIRDAGFEALIAGGAVRDAIQGVKPRDVDLVTTMWVREAERAMSRASIPTGWTRSEFGIMLVGRGSGDGLDLATLKTSHKGEFGCDLYEDLKTRDFTINATYYDPANGIILDPTGKGVEDAKNKVLRPACAPGQEQAWVKDNPSVVLRFIKFTLRGYSYDQSLLKLVKDNFASAVRDMDILRRGRMIDSVVPEGGDRKRIITDELKRLGFPQSDIDALYPPSFLRRSWGSDAEEDSRGGGLRPGGTSFGGGFSARSSSSSPGGGSAGATSGSASSVPANVYVGPSSSAVQEYARRNERITTADYGPHHAGLAAVEVGRLPQSESDAWRALFDAGFVKKQPGRYEHRDGSWLHFTSNNVFRGVGKTVFAGRLPTADARSTSSASITGGTTGGTPTSSGSGA